MPLLIIMSCVPVFIIKSVLKELYEKKKLNTYQIASIYNCCQATIWKRLHKFGIKSRAPGNPTDLDKKKLKNLYIKKKLSTWQIEKLYGYPRGTVHRKLKEYNIKTRSASESHIVYPRTDFSGDKIEKAYIIGFSMGDLRVRKVYPNSETILIDCGSTKKEQINLISRVFKPYGRIWISKPNKKGATQIECSLNESFNFLLRKRILADSWILKNKRYFWAFLAGFTDAEGCISISNKGLAYYGLGNYNKKLLNQIREFLIQNKISCSKLIESKIKGKLCFGKYYHGQNYWQFRVYKKTSLLLLFDFIGPCLKHIAKIKSVKRAKQNIEMRNKKFGNINMDL